MTIALQAAAPQMRWAKKHGDIFVYHGLFNIPRILITDPRLIQEVLVSGAYNYTKAPRTRRVLGRILGGIGRDLIHLIIAYTRHLGRPIIQGDVHKYQRKMLNPAFSLRYIRDMVPTFFEPVLALRDLWKTEMIGEDSLEVDVLDGMSRATLDIIGLAGFGYDFQAVNADPEKPSELSKAYSVIFSPRPRLMNTLTMLIPVLYNLPTASNLQMKRALITVDKVSKNLIKEARERKKEGNDGKDLLSSLVNEKNEETGEVMSDDDLKAQIMTFLAAG
ncbi:cytochrome P450 [Jimgerdemannia flammicorona]|uniref:Cytochrome P450 n=1 Tax=Jimgerdemannia flammicorona TaxID=994334 RepID=A0A433Q7Y3_9FUNG|nr:cytochrome P450 [Jimgerdemannia flammicorona]